MKTVLVILALGMVVFKFGELVLRMLFNLVGFSMAAVLALVFLDAANVVLRSLPFLDKQPVIAECCAFGALFLFTGFTFRRVARMVHGGTVRGMGLVAADVGRTGIVVGLVCGAAVTLLRVAAGGHIGTPWFLTVVVTLTSAVLDTAFPAFLSRLASASNFKMFFSQKETTMFKNSEAGRGFVAVLVLAGVVVLAIVAVLGDEFGPWVESAQEQFSNRLKDLVDREALELAKANKSLRAAKERAQAVAGEIAESEVRLRHAERDMRAANGELELHEAQLGHIQHCLEAGQPVKTRSQRALSTREISLRVKRGGQAIELARHKIQFLQSIHERRQARHERLIVLRDELPERIGQLEVSYESLGQKVQFYRELLAHAEREEEDFLDYRGVVAKAERALEDAHDKMDIALTKLDAQLNFGARTHAADDVEDVDSRDVLAEVRRILGNGKEDLIVSR